MTANNLVQASLTTLVGAVLASCSTAHVTAPTAEVPAATAPSPAATLIPPAPVYDTDPEKIVVVNNWKDFIDPVVLHQFTWETGVEIRYEELQSNDALEEKLEAGRTGYDVVFPSGVYLRREVARGQFQPLDKARITNLRNVDAAIARKLAMFDPDNEHAVNYSWGTTGIAFNVGAVKAALPTAPTDSFAMIWDPKVVSKFAHCGVAVLDSPTETVGTALVYLGKSPNSENPQDLAAAEKVMMAARPYIRLISSDYVDELVSGAICVGLDWSGDALQATSRALRDEKPYEIAYRLPREGSFLFMDSMAIPMDAPHARNAHLFIDYLLRADVAARNTNFTHFANGNGASRPLIDPEVTTDPNLYPTPEMQAKLVPDLPESAEFTRQLQRVWARFRAGGGSKSR